jgi:protein-serine/threonine kinase
MGITSKYREMFKYSNSGYTKAVDLWSLGCVTAVLLTGDTPFKNSLTADATELTRRKDREKLEADMDWNNTGHRARDFVLKLLVFDEAQRMDVKQALNHNWFTNPAHREAFEALYRRSIRDWKPRVREGPLVIDLCSLMVPPKYINEPIETSCSARCTTANLEEPYNGDHLSYQNGTFSASLESLNDRFRQGRPASLSPTLSDPDLPPHRRLGSTN